MFLIVLLWMDSFSIVRKKLAFWMFLWGIAAFFLSFHFNPWMFMLLKQPLISVPLTEEFFKGLGVLFLIRSKRSFFFIDSLIYGAFAGAGFAFMENIFYINQYPDMLIGTAVMRGLGTSIMHCGTVAGTAAILSWLSVRDKNTLLLYPIALIPGIIIHSLYNALLLPSYLTLLIVVFGVTGWIIALIFYNENSIGKWLDLEMNREVELLNGIKTGHFSESKAGRYLMNMQDQFPAEKLLDMYCYIRIYLEISLIGKRNLMLKEAGLEIPFEQEAVEKVIEFENLKKNIGRTGEMLLAPFVNNDKLLKWKIESIQKQAS